ncbi:MAG: ABC transporter substrate-binding protein [Gammaproteobacteria bacterium]|nr:ABC transporter substrate-binding protein [Gammaproteobacteria bacterium]
MASIRIYENLRTLSYAPFYLAAVENLFADHALEVAIITSPSTTETALGLLEGRVDVSWGGPMRVMKHHDADSQCPLVCFAKVVGPEPFTLVGRYRNAAFSLTDLIGLRVGVVTDVPTPWLLLQEDLRRVGIDPSVIDQSASGSLEDNVAALAAGKLDVIQTMEPHAGQALAQGGHLWHRFADRGDVAFTSFYTTREFAQREREACDALTKAMSEAVQQMNSRPVGELAERIHSYFPTYTPGAIAAGLQRYREARIWPADCSLRQPEFVRLKLALLAGGFITHDVPYERAVLKQA